MFKLHPAQELGVVDESVALDLLLAAWGINKLKADREERQKIRLLRQLNREHAYMIGLAVNGKEIPEIKPVDEGEQVGDDTTCVWGGCKECQAVNGVFAGCPESDEIRRVFGANVDEFVKSARADGRHE